MDAVRVRLLLADGTVDEEIEFLGMGVEEATRHVRALVRSKPDAMRWTPQVFVGGEWRNAWRDD